jgi:hypothetical protein
MKKKKKNQQQQEQKANVPADFWQSRCRSNDEISKAAAIISNYSIFTRLAYILG